MGNLCGCSALAWLALKEGTPQITDHGLVQHACSEQAPEVLAQRVMLQLKADGDPILLGKGRAKVVAAQATRTADG